jgi:hypothetical protein
MIAGATSGVVPNEQAEAARNDDIFDFFIDDRASSEVIRSKPAAKLPAKTRRKIEIQEAASIFDLFPSAETAPKGNAIESPAAKATAKAVASRRAIPKSITAADDVQVAGAPPNPKTKPGLQPTTRLAAAAIAKPKVIKKPQAVSAEITAPPKPLAKPTLAKPSSEDRAPVKLAAKPADEPDQRSANVSCEKAKSIIVKFAFSNVEAKSCEGNTYSFAATRSGKQFFVRVSALSGELVEVRKMPNASDNRTLRSSEKEGEGQTGNEQSPYHLIPKRLLPRAD